MMAKGQEPFEPTDEQRELVAILAGNGIPQEVICRLVLWPSMTREAGKPISDRTLRKAFREELNHGMAMANGRVMRSLFESAVVAKNVTAQIFWLKTRAGWKEPAQDVNLHQTYGQLVEEAMKEKPERPALTLVKP